MKYKRSSFEKQHRPIYKHTIDWEAKTYTGHIYYKIENKIKDLLFKADNTITLNWFNWNNCSCGQGPVNSVQIELRPFKTVISAPYSVLKASSCQTHLVELKTHISLDNFILVSGDPLWKEKLLKKVRKSQQKYTRFTREV